MSEPKDVQGIDPALFRGLTERRFSRRDLLRYTGVGVGALSVSALLAACGEGGGKDQETGTGSAAQSLFAGQPAGVLDFANWPYYMDKGKDAQGNVVHPSLDKFTADTGIEVNYTEPIQDNASFFGKIQPQLQAGQSTGFDIIVITNGEFLTKLMALNYLIELPTDMRPNFDQYAAEWVKNRSYDPGGKYTMPWQSGFTGIGWNPEVVAQLRPDKPEITSMQDLFDPAFNGKVGMFGDTADMPSFGLLAIGVAPEESTPDDWQKAADLLTKQRDDGIVRQYYAQNYINALIRGDVALSMGWSGDIYQANKEGESSGMQFCFPSEGSVIWIDNMCIPVGVQHPVDAITYMDYVYKPDVAAMITEWVAYISPCGAARDVILEQANNATGKEQQDLQSLANSPLIFPTGEIAANAHTYRVLTEEEQMQWNGIFQPVYQG